MEEMTPKNMLAQLAKREGWLVPRFERDKSAEGIRYVVSVERSTGPKYKRKPTLVCSTHDEDEPTAGGWLNINDAQNGGGYAARLFEASFSKENQIVPLELSEHVSRFVGSVGHRVHEFRRRGCRLRTRETIS